MTTTTQRHVAPRPAAHLRLGRALRRPLTALRLRSWSVHRGLVVVIALAGVGVLLFPMTANWFHDRAHAATERAYARSIATMTPAATKRQLRQAQAYNRHLPTDALADPYASSPDGSPIPRGPAADRYDRTLAVGPDGMMGTLSVPGLGVDLPIYHGTAPTTLARGLGHLYGTSLPVGGPGTHTVITGHSGIPGNALFTRLRELHLGDTFTITVLDQVLTYRVDQILTVLPNQTDALTPVAGRDYATLVTCTPIGVNSHRLLVRGVRVQTPSGAAQTPDALATASRGRFPWWVLIALGSILVVLAITASLLPARRRGTEV